MSTGETTEFLVDQLAAAGGWPEPRLLAALLERGGEAVEPLRAMIRRDLEDKTITAPLSLAVEVLGSLGDASAVPDMLDLLRRHDEIDVLETLRSAMRAFGPEVIEPALEIARDRSLGAYPRATAAEIASEAAGDDPVARAGVAEALREMLADSLARGKEDNPDEVEMATNLVDSLCDLADPLARELIARAFEAGMINGWMIAPEDVEAAYLRGGRAHRGKPRSWLSEYETAYERHLEWQRRRAEPRPEPRDVAPRLTEPARPIPPPLTPTGRKVPKPGRNDPCWCGSGKKYKKCHLTLDQAKG